MISVASASFSSFSTTLRSAWYPGVTAPAAMCSRARLRSVAMSERKAPAMLLALARGGGQRRARGAARARLVRVAGVLGLDVGLRLVVVRLGLLLARALFLALLRVALLLRDLVRVLGLRFLDVALVARRRVVLLLHLGLGDLLLALGVGFADVLLVALHRLALRHVGLVLGLDAILVRAFLRVVGARGVAARGARAGVGAALRLRRAGEAEREAGGDDGQFQFHRDLLSLRAFSAGPRPARPGKGRRTRRTGSWRSRPRRPRCR